MKKAFLCFFLSLRTFIGRPCGRFRRQNLILHVVALCIAAVPVEKLHDQPNLWPLHDDARPGGGRLWAAAAKTARNGQHGEFFENFSNFFRKKFFSSKLKKKCLWGVLDRFRTIFDHFLAHFAHF